MAQFYSAKRRVTTRQIITVTVNDLDPFGQGVARHQGKALFIPGLLPQEQAEVVLVEDKKQYARAQVKRRLNDSPQRVAPRCPHFGVCGGCQQQHASIELQQQSKRAALSRLMKRDVDDIIAAEPWGYRRRARLSLNYQPKTQQLQMGFRKANSSEIIDVVQCPVLAPQLEALLPAVRECLTSLQSQRQLGHVELVQADNGPLMVLRHTAALTAADKEKLERFSQTHGLSLYLAPQSEILEHIRGDEPWYTSDGLRLVFSPRDFIQVNDGVNQKMVRTALAWLDIQPQDRVLDLFCGMGNFTLPLAKAAASVVGVEGVPALVAKGRENAALNELQNVTFFHENLEEDVTRQAWAKHGFDKILLDPARAGAPGVMAHIIKLAPRRVVYVSCNPATLARDSEALLQVGYRIQRLAMLDMFPHTGHLESIVLFERELT
ncbi:23S rRNA (uracil(1939)-C(5))-methyltransferase RlmD [Klebsiella aerogenes]|uniref:23S rRNA (uracil(1939)-C(5))-methyltransferase RlmD n=1 Tax=Klebsiella aerogenes (strain ATCC 13048 / DSM 30053 / CCUG 1429 / JCM 1235 / KCTC 2190 / NBRC 13534 / NCIMB 10102 / NCTC 10006 / CDC 819-56) TaxID=1028307 RepID=A0A0H3FKG0_KLEAK|nr:23S rRNA (uracil(1939)-C(5))-methyltransferase RlmD [Klebsiella aerogenes]MCL6715007.1 23S rRNA (uracil(1939)-C(5))-methyltransferase RlmD [Klebsiella sp. T2.Ur]AEG95329.1 23S rRNA m(5)U1939 methyltransferase [Klebsiella aerogenes KCTC 2190]ELA0416476.1 23S rRNA (uracil(1939)-C(5))-methyltransferase RlmD [Klebsiella aerogenes]KLF32919.1 23S rRNA methyltransferase [Klebsiella aerogenes]MBK0635384.1 23S rRNA (uracil(1939)-C(5))-methyltransferase RlmD [Klebsiella aerogenes]